QHRGGRQLRLLQSVPRELPAGDRPGPPAGGARSLGSRADGRRAAAGPLDRRRRPARDQEAAPGRLPGSGLIMWIHLIAAALAAIGPAGPSPEEQVMIDLPA